MKKLIKPLCIFLCLFVIHDTCASEAKASKTAPKILQFGTGRELLDHPHLFVSMADQKKDRSKKAQDVKLLSESGEYYKWRIMEDKYLDDEVAAHLKSSGKGAPVALPKSEIHSFSDKKSKLPRERKIKVRRYKLYVPYFNKPVFRRDATLIGRNVVVEEGTREIFHIDRTRQPTVENWEIWKSTILPIEYSPTTLTNFGRKFLLGTAITAAALFGVLYQFRSRK